MTGSARTITKAEEALAEHFDALPKNDPLREARDRAYRTFTKDGLPHRRVEEWKYTDLRSLMRVAHPPAPRPSIEDARRAAAAAAPLVDGAWQLVFVDGHLFEELSSVEAEKIEITSLRRVLDSGSSVLDRLGSLDLEGLPILALNGAFVQDGVTLRVKADVELDRPLEIVQASTGTRTMAVLRHFAVFEPGSSATVVERFVGPDGADYQVNSVSELQVRENAHARWVKVQREGDEALHMSMLIPRVDAGAVFDPFTLTMGAKTSRAECRLIFAGEGANVGARGLNLVKDRQHADFTLMVDHAVPACNSRELFKSAIDDEATAVFQGKIVVRPDAQKTDGQMMSQALLLSDGGTFNNKPELEIFADDVQCAHGATCGQLDEDLLFYLLSRGLPPRQAETLLVMAFLAEAVEEAELGELGETLEAIAFEWLEARVR